MKKLYVIMVGGYPPGSHLEVHDLRFHLADSFEETYPRLRTEWWGGPDRFHIDGWGVLEWIDGYDVVIADARPAAAADKKLYFVHIGGYRAGHFGELHEEVFVVAADQAEAKAKALARGAAWDQRHRDVLSNVETVVAIEPDGLWLVPNDEAKPFVFEIGYMPQVGKTA